MDSSEQSQPSQQAAEGAAPPYPMSPDDGQTVAMASGAYPPPYTPPSPLPPTSAAPQPATRAAHAPARMARVQALDLLSRLKATLLAGSVIAFGVFAGLAAAHVTGVSSRSSATQSPQAAPTATPAPSRHDDDGGFFNTAPSNGFGIGAPSQQGPASSTSVS